jgi:transposase
VLSLPAAVRIFVAAHPVDLRRGFEGLASAVRQQLGKDPLSGHLFVFFGRRGDLAKILVWTRGGFWLLTRRLEQGRFRLPPAPADATHVEFDSVALQLLLDGIDLREAKRRPAWSPR